MWTLIRMEVYYDFCPRLNAEEWQRSQLHDDCKTVSVGAGKYVMLFIFVTKQVRYVLVQRNVRTFSAVKVVCEPMMAKTARGCETLFPKRSLWIFTI